MHKIIHKHFHLHLFHCPPLPSRERRRRMEVRAPHPPHRMRPHAPGAALPQHCLVRPEADRHGRRPCPGVFPVIFRSLPFSSRLPPGARFPNPAPGNGSQNSPVLRLLDTTLFFIDPRAGGAALIGRASRENHPVSPRKPPLRADSRPDTTPRKTTARTLYFLPPRNPCQTFFLFFVARSWTPQRPPDWQVAAGQQAKPRAGVRRSGVFNRKRKLFSRGISCECRNVACREPCPGQGFANPWRREKDSSRACKKNLPEHLDQMPEEAFPVHLHRDAVRPGAHFIFSTRGRYRPGHSGTPEAVARNSLLITSRYKTPHAAWDRSGGHGHCPVAECVRKRVGTKPGSRRKSNMKFEKNGDPDV